ncbi:hypothetical protein L1987_72109 [Smallanthus sonchifolius]|uniref:Uncharacterized protein n=1 Tax=Smallanthus sonchifolius TaxID=185202 RepID=A0ACB9AVM8_9ASTR|nr:hypothetical protein L1987_72109 [Smallanthus sonchifolius]
MPRSSRSKSHKQSKHSSKEAAAAREYSGSDEDVKMKDRSSNCGKEDAVPVRISKDSSVSGERVKHIKDLSNTHGNGDVLEEYTTSSKRREEKSHGGSDRWNGGNSDDKGLLVNVESKESLKSKDFSKVSESKSKSSRRHDVDSVEKDESKSGSGNRGEKRKPEKESARKESSQYKEHKESKDKDRGSDRGRKVHHDKPGAETSSKQVENQTSKSGKENTEWPIEEELRNPELEKELEKRMRRRGEASGEKDKYHDDIKETDDRRLSTRNDRSKDERHKNEEYGDIRETRQKDEKHREDNERDRKSRDVKHRGESDRYNKHRDDKYDKHREDKYSEDGSRETKYKDDRYIEIGDKDERSRDGKRKQDDDRDYRHKEEKRARDSKYGDVPEAKRLRDDNVGTDLYHKKTSNRDGSPVHDDRVARYKDDKDRRRGNEKDESSDYRSRSSMKEQRSELEKRSSAKDDLVSERGRLGSRHTDVENTTSHSRRRSSPSGSSYPTRDHHRVSKQEETKYRDYAYEDQARHNVHSSRDYSSAPAQSDKKVTSKDDSYMGGDLVVEKRARLESRSSLQVDKSPSSSNERKNLINTDARKNPDFEESGPGPRSGGSKDTFKDGKGSRELVNEAHMNNEFSQIDNDNLSVSSPYSRNSHFSEDERSKSNNRNRRMVDPNMNRGQSQIQSQGNWKNVPNWPPPMAAGGYIPFQHVPPPMFHPLMQQFPIFDRPPMKLNPGLPYHAPDHVRPLGWRNQMDESVPPPLHGWDTNNSVFGDEAHLYGRLDWDRRSQLSNQGWDQSGEMWKGQNAGSSMEVQLGQQKDEYSGRPNDDNLSVPTGQPDESDPNQLDIQPETLNLDKNGPEAQKLTGSPKIFEVVKEDNNAIITQAYLSRLDVSKDLTQPELYDQCTSMIDLDQEDFSQPVEFDCKILYLEEGTEANVTNSASLFDAINDSVFQKAMFLYKKQKEEFHSINAAKGGPEADGKPAEEVTAEDTVMDVDKEIDEPANKPVEEVTAEDTVMEVNKENDESPNKPEEPMDMEVDHAVVKQEEVPESTVAEVKESLAPSASGGLLPCKIEDATNDYKNGGGDSSVLSDVSTAEVAVMPTESNESGSVNLNRIHPHSPESTH